MLSDLYVLFMVLNDPETARWFGMPRYKYHISSRWTFFYWSIRREESNCTAIHTRIMDDWLECDFTCGVDCRGQGKYPCLQVFVNLTHLGQKALLRYNEATVQKNSKVKLIKFTLSR